jgi:hypothetical protein
MEPRKRKIIGVQVHHSTKARDASMYGANMATALGSVFEMTDDPRWQVLADQAVALVRQVSSLSREANERLHEYQSLPNFEAMVAGDEPWPDETVEGFEARCRCADRCMFHDNARGNEADCNCDQRCRAHS